MTTAQPVENVGRGATFALLSIPIAIIGFSLLAGLFGFFSGIVAIAVPYVASFLYAKGAGAPLTRKGWGPFVAVTLVAVVIGTFSGIVASAWAAFSTVHGTGGILGSAFWTTVRNQFTTGLGDTLVPLLIGLGLGVIGIVSALRGNAGFTSRRIAPQDMPPLPGAAEAADATAPVIPPAPPTATQPTATPPTANKPSPGIILNGEPLDPDNKDTGKK